MNPFPEFQIIQGGMGVGISGWKLARAVSMEHQLGVVSGTALDLVLARSLQLGDVGGHLRRALEAFPRPAAAERILKRFFIEGGKDPDTPFLPVPMASTRPGDLAADLTLAGAFAAVFLAKEGHDHPVGINLLEKIQLPTLLVLFGAMLAGVDVVLMGAGIPRHIPGILDRFAGGESAEMPLHVEGKGTGGDEARVATLTFDPASLFPPEVLSALRRPYFLAIVASPTLARHLAQKATGRVDGFVVEGHTAGGHNAPPRGGTTLSASGEPVYGAKDEADPAAFRALGLPFWLAGGYGHPGGLQEALALGAAGIQVGTPFAFCEESGLDPDIKRSVLESVRRGPVPIFTDPKASPTGFPFKIVPVAGSLSEPEVYACRERICDIGLLREAYADENGAIKFRCPAEPVGEYLKKGGNPADTDGRACLCNGLLATIGLGQQRPGSGSEPPLVTAGDGIDHLPAFLEGRTSYHAADVLRLLRAPARPPSATPRPLPVAAVAGFNA